MHALMTPEFPILKDQFLQVMHFQPLCYKTHLQQSVGMPHVIILRLGAYLCHGLQSQSPLEQR